MYGHNDKITINKPTMTIKESGPEKFQELADIHKQILSLGVVPDFGYQLRTIGDENITGWSMFYDYLKKEPKLQRFHNLVQ